MAKLIYTDGNGVEKTITDVDIAEDITISEIPINEEWKSTLIQDNLEAYTYDFIGGRPKSSRR